MAPLRKLTREGRIRAVRESAGLSEEQAGALCSPGGGLDFARADRMVENAVGTFALPLGVAENFVINGRPTLVPMAIEEPSVVAAPRASSGSSLPCSGSTSSDPAFGEALGRSGSREFRLRASVSTSRCHATTNNTGNEFHGNTR